MNADAVELWIYLWKQRSHLPLGTDALERVAAYAWPGGSGEMRDVVAVVAERARGPVVGRKDIPALPLRLAATPPPPPKPVTMPGGMPGLPVKLARLLQDLEDAYVDGALLSAGGNRRLAAEMLGMGRTTLVEKLKRRAQRARRANS